MVKILLFKYRQYFRLIIFETQCLININVSLFLLIALRIIFKRSFLRVFLHKLLNKFAKSFIGLVQKLKPFLRLPSLIITFLIMIALPGVTIHLSGRILDDNLLFLHLVNNILLYINHVFLLLKLLLMKFLRFLSRVQQFMNFVIQFID